MDTPSPEAVDTDVDDDGWPIGDDCDDTDSSVHPDATELCNGVDDDCDGEIDEEAADGTLWFRDEDADGYGGEVTTVSCDPASGWLALDGDCDDTQPTVFPGAEELCDSFDTDCDPSTVEDGMLSADGVAISSVEEGLDAEMMVICAGTWPVNLELDHDMFLYAPAGPDLTVLEAASPGAVLRVTEGAEVNLLGFEIRGGTASGIDGTDAGELTLDFCRVTGNSGESGGGVKGPLVGTLLMRTSEVVGNAATTGGGVYLQGGELALVDTLIEGNSAEAGGGLALQDVLEAEADDGSIIADNTASNGGGVHLTNAVLSGPVRVENNLASEAGGGVWANYGAIDGAQISGNSAAEGGGLRLGSVCDLFSATVEYNLAEQGGGLHVTTAADIIDVVIRGNEAGFGAGILTRTGVLLQSVTIEQNIATDAGGGLAIEQGVGIIELVDTVFHRNSATTGGGAWLDMGRLVCEPCDWGADADDNLPEDIWLDPVGAFNFGTEVSFDCDGNAGTCE